jgi:branched-chain amino acid transport system ATP-binding protein
MEVSSQVVVLDAGAKIAEGPPKQVATNDAVIEAYLGRSKSVDRKRVRALTLSPTPVLRAEGVWAGYGSATVLRDVMLHVNNGEVVAVIGANGAGKTTLTRVLSGRLEVSQPETWWSGRRQLLRFCLRDRVLLSSVFRNRFGRGCRVAVLDGLSLGAPERWRC